MFLSSLLDSQLKMSTEKTKLWENQKLLLTTSFLISSSLDLLPVEKRNEEAIKHFQIITT